MAASTGHVYLQPQLAVSAAGQRRAQRLYQGLAAVGKAFCVAWTGADAGTAQVFTAVAPAAD